MSMLDYIGLLWEERNSVFSRYGSGTVGLLAWFLGFCFCLGLWITVEAENLTSFGLYFTLLATFHMSEWLVTAAYNPRELSADSFLLNHSPEYIYASISAFVEFFVEYYFFPGWKQCLPLIIIGFLVSVFGIALRLTGMITAQAAFTHQIKENKRQEHHLVTEGVYAFIRHPGYCGWFWWTVASQILLGNPICTIGFAIASWRFFSRRIPAEEHILMTPEFFGDKYKQFRDRTPTYIPFIN